MKKIVSFLYSFGPGGAERTTLNICNYLARSGRYKIFLLLGGQQENCAYLKQLDCNVEVVFLGRGLPVIFSKLIISLRRIRPDILFTTLRWSNVIGCFMKLFVGDRIKLVIRENSPLWLSIAHRDNVKKITFMSKIRSFFTLLLVKTLYAKADKIVSLSKGVASEILKMTNVPASKLEVIYNSVDMALIKHMMEKEDNVVGFRNDCKNIIAIGSFNQRKGFKYLFEAIEILITEFKRKVNLIILGDGNLRFEFEQYVVENGLERSICLPGVVQNPFLYLSRSDIFVLSSEHEGFGNVIIEAMACGVPVIATNCPYGPREILTDGYDGILIKTKSSLEIALGIIHLLNDTELCFKIRINALRRVQDFSIEKIGLKYVALFESLL